MIRMTVLSGVLLLLCAGAWALTIHDVQYTSSRGVDNSYPSPYLGKTVTLEGVVTAANYRGGGFFLSESVSGAWRGIYVSCADYLPASGTYLRLTGKVGEVFGMTCLQDIQKYLVLDRNRALPKPVIISSGQLESPLEAEAYEGVYARLINSSASGSKASTAGFTVNDGSGRCSVNLDGFSARKATPPVGTQYAQIAGIVVFSRGEYSLNPFAPSDLQTQQPVSTQNRSWGKIKSIYK